MWCVTAHKQLTSSPPAHEQQAFEEAVTSRKISLHDPSFTRPTEVLPDHFGSSASREERSNSVQSPTRPCSSQKSSLHVQHMKESGAFNVNRCVLGENVNPAAWTFSACTHTSIVRQQLGWCIQKGGALYF